MLQRYSHLSGEDRKRASGAVENMFKSAAVEKVVPVEEGKKKRERNH